MEATETVTVEPVRKTVTVRAGADRAFETFMLRMGRWWPAGHSVLGDEQQADVVVEPGVGGRWYERGEAGTERQWGRVLRWDPPRGAVLAWQLNAAWTYDPDLHTEVEVRFTELGDGRTRVDFEHRGLEAFGAAAQAIRDSLATPNGWSGMLDVYVSLFEG